MKTFKWDTYTHTKILIVGLCVIGLLVSCTAIGNIFAYRENADEIIVSLTIGGAGMFLINIARKIKSEKRE